MRDLTRLMLRIGMILFLLAGCVYNVNEFAKLTKTKLNYDTRRYRGVYYDTYNSSTRTNNEYDDTLVSSSSESDDFDYDY